VEKSPIHLKVLSQATSVPGQGVGSAYIEQLQLIKQSKKIIIQSHKNKTIDLFHIHTVNFIYLLRMLFTKKPTIVYVHFLPSTLNASIKLPKLFFGLFKWYVKFFYLTADYLVVVNPIFIEPLVKMGIKKAKIHFIPNYVDENKFKTNEKPEILREKYKFDKFTVLGVGQVQHRKGVLDFVELAVRLPEIDFVWAGGFSFKNLTFGYEDFRKIMDNPPKNVRFLGIVPRESMKELYAACDLFFLPSFDELMPMSVLEAAVSHKPILLRDLPLYEPVFFGHYLKAQSLDEFAKIIERLSRDKDYYQQSLDHPTWLRNFYRKEAILKQWEDYYQEVVKNHGKTH
jgi:1,2-diacylglycerol-3-alpha-glucose alpha-1,2-galactosyltransferase